LPSSLHKLPAGVSDEAAVMLSDIMPTGFEIGVRNGKLQPGNVVAVVGAGPVGLSAMMTAGLYGASRLIAIDIDENRLAQAKTFGATDSVNSGNPGWLDELVAMTDEGLGVDVAIEAVGVPQTFQMALDIIPCWRDGGQRWRERKVGGAHFRTSGSRTSTSPPAWSAPPPPPRCCSSWLPRASSPRRSSCPPVHVRQHH
jgi:hypothetical protein